MKAIDNNTIKLTALLPDQTKLAAICCYAPSDSDDPKYWESVFEEFSNLEAEYKFISGDFNVTLDPEMDTQGYLTDPHKKSRIPINAMIEADIVNDLYRDIHPDKKAYTWRTQKGDKRARLDYFLSTPALSKVATDIRIKHNIWDISDHASIVAEFDINCAKSGKGVFRCPPNLHKKINKLSETP